MKNIILISLLLSTFLIAQQQYYPSHEIFLRSTNYNTHDSLKIWMQASSPVYGANPYYMTTEFDSCSTIIPIPYDGSNANLYGFSHVNTPENNPYSDFGFGLYKVSFGYNYITPIFYFYLDWRDCDYPISSYYNWKNDIWIEFDDLNKSCKVRWDHLSTWKQILQGGTYKLWIEKNKIAHHNIQNTDCFELLCA